MSVTSKKIWLTRCLSFSFHALLHAFLETIYNVCHECIWIDDNIIYVSVLAGQADETKGIYVAFVSACTKDGEG